MALNLRSDLPRYGFAVAVSAVAVASKLWWSGTLGHPAPFRLVSTAILLSAWLGGVGPGLLATALSTLAIWFFFLPPFHTWRLDSLNVLVLIGTFLVEGTLISLIVSSLDRARRQSRETRLKAEVMRDVTQQINARAHARMARMDLVVKLFQATAEGPDALHRAVRRVVELLEADHAWLMEPSADGRSLRCDRLDPRADPIADVPVDSDAPEARAFAGGSPAFVDEATGGKVCVAIPGEDRPRAVLVIRSDHHRAPTRADREFLRDVASALGHLMSRRPDEVPAH